MFSDVLLTADYDRTITAPDSSVPRRNLEAIRYFMANGGTFTVNTGRSIPMTRAFRDRVPVNAPLLLYNGSGAYDLQKEEMLFCHEIREDPWAVADYCLKAFPDLTFEIQGLDAHYRFKEDPMWDALSDNNHCARAFAERGHVFDPFLKFSLYGEIRTNRISDMFEGTEEELKRMDAAQQQLTAVFGDRMEIFRAGARIIDVHAKGVSKMRSARELKEKLQKKILVCIGDGENDVSMLKGADYAFCPADAAVADRFINVCSCGQGAVADVIYREIPKILAKKLDIPVDM